MQVVLFQQADTVLGRDTAAVALHYFKHLLADLATAPLEFFHRKPIRLQHVQVQVTVAYMAIPDNLEIGIARADHRLNFRQK